MKDLKESLSSSRKPDITHVRKALMVYIARGCEYGDKTQGGKYVRSNFMRPASEHPKGSLEALRADFKRLRSYLRAVQSHVTGALDALERHTALDPDLNDLDGMRRAAYAEDADAMPDCVVGPSFLPELAGCAASLNMAITQGVESGLLPSDPGQPWRGPKGEAWRAKADPVAALVNHVEAGGSVRVKGTAVDAELAIRRNVLAYLQTCVESASWVALCAHLPFKRDDLKIVLETMVSVGDITKDAAGYRLAVKP